MAGNPSTPPRLLTGLSRDSDMAVQDTVAGNPSTPVKTLSRMASSHDRDVAEQAKRTLGATPLRPSAPSPAAPRPPSPSQLEAVLKLIGDTVDWYALVLTRDIELMATCPALLDSRRALLDPFEVALVSLSDSTGTVDVDAIRAQLESGLVPLAVVQAKAEALSAAAATVHSTALAAGTDASKLDRLAPLVDDRVDDDKNLAVLEAQVTLAKTQRLAARAASAAEREAAAAALPGVQARPGCGAP